VHFGNRNGLVPGPDIKGERMGEGAFEPLDTRRGTAARPRGDNKMKHRALRSVDYCIAERSILTDPNGATNTSGTFNFTLNCCIFHVSRACDVNF